jgi:hypothetical protein
MLSNYVFVYAALAQVINPLVCGSTSLHLQKLTDKEPNDFDLSILPSEVDKAKEIMNSLGYGLHYDFPNNDGFDLRMQFVSMTDRHVKIDFFLHSGIEGVKVGSLNCVPAEVVWAARGYYASRKHEKAMNQLLEVGFVAKWNVQAEVATDDSSYGNKDFDNDTHYDFIEEDSDCHQFVKAAENLSKLPIKVGAMYIQDGKRAYGYNTSDDYDGHAEVNALAHFAEKYPDTPINGGKMYCTFSGCTCCSKKMDDLNIRSYFVHKYKGKM